jgi:hypothetical protein
LICYKIILNILSLDRTPLFTVLFDNHLFCWLISLETILHFEQILLLSNHLVQGYDLVCIASKRILIRFHTFKEPSHVLLSNR